MQKPNSATAAHALAHRFFPILKPKPLGSLKYAYNKARRKLVRALPNRDHYGGYGSLE